jgi:hypothetical protein
VETLADRRLRLTGLATDNAPVSIFVRRPGSDVFTHDGDTVADMYATFVYTTSVLTVDGTYSFEAWSIGVRSINIINYTLPNPNPPLRLAVIRLGDMYDSNRATYVSALDPTITHSNGITLGLRGDDQKNPLLWFDTSGLPAHAQVQMAKMSLYALTGDDSPPCRDMVAYMYEVTKPWDEQQATWITATQGLSWTQPGVNDVPLDRREPAVFTETLREANRWYTWDVTSLGRQWVDNPARNLGTVVKAFGYGRRVISMENELDQGDTRYVLRTVTAGISKEYQFASPRFDLTRRRPVLFLTYTVPNP